ncbi:MAG: Crp/Fnr family transcriptional regulator [Fimbriimonadaceae bacterium]|nr:Crp/Fnr family transcriptional regulator [Fimbriimonadaceae bacterium]
MSHIAKSPAPSEVIELLSKSLLFQELSESQIAQYCSGGSIRKVAEGNNLFFKDDPAGLLFIILEGFLSIESETAPGESTLLKLRGPGEIIGELSMVVESGRTADVIAMTECRVYAWSGVQIQEGLEDDPLIAMGMIKLLGEKLVESITDRVASFWSADARLAHTLIDLARRTGIRREDRTVLIPLELSQKTLSRLIHCSREHTNKALGRWRREGLIEYDEKQRIILIQIKALKAMAAPL